VPLGRDSAHAGQPVSVLKGAAERGTVRDRLGIFCCAANSDFPSMNRRSVMTPAEGAFFLGVPNIIMVRSSTTESKYGRLEPPFAQYMVALRPLTRVVWSVVGSGGSNPDASRCGWLPTLAADSVNRLEGSTRAIVATGLSVTSFFCQLVLACSVLDTRHALP
jgi:hypothetical protein